MIQTTEFLGLDFAVASRSSWRDLLFAHGRDRFSYLVTPNVDHIVKIDQQTAIREVYDRASWRVCDSRILAALARFRGVELSPYPGADLVRDLLADRRATTLRIGLIGPSSEDVASLKDRYRQLVFQHIPAPMMEMGTAEWQTSLAAVEACEADIFLICISFPKQEYFAHELLQRGHARGLAVCAGASLDFLVGRQKRAPLVMRRMGTEWLFRLLSNPKRLWRRYLVDGPRILGIYLRKR